MKDIDAKLEEIRQNMVTKAELNRHLDTLEILGNGGTMQQIVASEADIVAGRIKEVSSVDDM